MPPTLTAQWNTGRLYARDGQRIRAELVMGADGPRVLFADFSRGIFSEFTPTTALPLPTSPEALQRRVMAVYDSNKGYRMSCEAMQLRWKD